MNPTNLTRTNENPDRRTRDHRLEGLQRSNMKRKAVKMRDKDGASWLQIAEAVGVSSAGTARRLYNEAKGEGASYDSRVEGKGGRTRTWTPGDWCDARCIGAHPMSECECRCAGANHAGGGAVAEVLLEDERNQHVGHDAEEIQSMQNFYIDRDITKEEQTEE